MEWANLLDNRRFSDLKGRKTPKNKPQLPANFLYLADQFRLPQERDHDRILFSTPYRRLGDKTQVFPLESIESIRTRLTHSNEVASLARSIGQDIARYIVKKPNKGKKLPVDIDRKIPAVLYAAGLAHDIGNPPFGHQGEEAIRAWFFKNQDKVFCLPTSKEKMDISLSDQHKADFLEFEGNAQTLRVLSKLQVISDDLGLNLTLGTLAATMKYVVPSTNICKKTASRKKFGFFASEAHLVSELRSEVGIVEYHRHPLALVMEACDDIAYSVVDAEDAIKKGLVSLNDVIAALKRSRKKVGGADAVIKYLCSLLEWELRNLLSKEIHPDELNDIATQKFRVHAIHLMANAVTSTFKKKYARIMDGRFTGSLVEESPAASLCRALKKFDRENSFTHKSVLKIELNGYNVLHRLMDYLWIGITDREDFGDVGSKRLTPFAEYVYSRISKNYRRVFEDKIFTYHKEDKLPTRYREMQLLTDMVSGMTDQFCVDLHKEFDKLYRKEFSK